MIDIIRLISILFGVFCLGVIATLATSFLYDRNMWGKGLASKGVVVIIISSIVLAYLQARHSMLEHSYGRLELVVGYFLLRVCTLVLGLKTGLKVLDLDAQEK